MKRPTGPLLALLVVGLAAATFAAASPRPADAASPARPGPIHGAGSEAGPSVSLTGTVRPMAPSAVPATASCTAWASESIPPATIRVYRIKSDTVDVVDFRTYVRTVATGEFDRTWPFQLLAVGAIAAKQNAWYWTMHGREWTNLATWGGVARPIERVIRPDGSAIWQTTAASPAGPGQCWDLTDDPGIDQCYDCFTNPVDPLSAPRNEAAVDATWWVTVRRPVGGVPSFFAPGYEGRAAATCPPMSSEAEWSSWFTGRIDFNPDFARSPQGQGEIWRVDLNHLIGFETTYADVQCALGHLQLGYLVVEIENGYRRTAVHANYCSAGLDFRPRLRLPTDGHRWSAAD